MRFTSSSGSPCQMMAVCWPRVLRWRSRQLTVRFSWPSSDLNLGVQFRVADAFHVVFRLALPDDGGLLAACFEMAIQAVDGEIQLAVFRSKPRRAIPRS